MVRESIMNNNVARKSLWKRLLFSVVFFLILFVSLDIFIGSRRTAGSGQSTWNLHDTDDKLGWKLRPGAHVVDEEKNNYTVDDNGFRLTSPLEAPTRTVFIFGDSFTFGQGVDDRDCFASLLATRYAGRGIRVINGGVIGYGLTQMYQRFLDSEDLVQEGDIVIFAPISADLSRNLREFRFVSQFLLRKESNIGSYPSYENGKISHKRIDTPLNYAKALMFAGMFTGRVTSFVYRKLMAQDTTIDNALAMLEDIRTRTEQKKASFALIFLPTPPEIIRGRYRRDVSRFTYHDIRESFPSDPEELMNLTFQRDMHWNPTGHKLAANAISSKLQDLGFIETTGKENE